MSDRCQIDLTSLRGALHTVLNPNPNPTPTPNPNQVRRAALQAIEAWARASGMQVSGSQLNPDP